MVGIVIGPARRRKDQPLQSAAIPLYLPAEKLPSQVSTRRMRSGGLRCETLSPADNATHLLPVQAMREN